MEMLCCSVFWHKKNKFFKQIKNRPNSNAKNLRPQKKKITKKINLKEILKFNKTIKKFKYKKENFFFKFYSCKHFIFQHNFDNLLILK